MEETVKKENKKSVFKIIGLVTGTISGLVGAFHGYLEIQHGNISTKGIVIDALKDGHVPMPAMTLIPNFLFTGIISLIIGLMILFWVTFFIQKKSSSIVIIILSLLLLLCGGGFAPPGLGILCGIVCLRINNSNI